MTSKSDGNGWVLDGLLLVLLFVAALHAFHHYAGSSPIVWVDTFNDEKEVERCLTQSSCTFVGMQTSLPGQFHAVSWLSWRTLLAWLGIGSDGTHLVLQLADAAMVVLVFVLGRQLAGAPAGLLAVLILMLGIGEFPIRSTALFNTRPLPFLGSVLLLSCTAAALRPTAATLLMAAAVAAILTNVHLACVISAVSVVAIALFAPARRLRLALIAASGFAAATFLLAPPSWLTNFASIGSRGGSHGVVSAPPLDNPLTLWAWLGIAMWLAAWLARTPAVVLYRRQAAGAIALLLPFLLAFSVAPLVGIDAGTKYLAHLKAPTALAAALPLGWLAAAALARVMPAALHSLAERVGLVFVVALIAFPDPRLPSAVGERVPTIADLNALQTILMAERGWRLPDVLERLKSPDAMPILTGFLFRSAQAAPAEPALQSDLAATVALLAPDELPQPLPADWQVVRRGTGAVTVLILGPSLIDWSRFEVCGADGACRQSDLRLAAQGESLQAPHLPLPWPKPTGRLRLKLPLRAASAGESYQ
ncbi:MAG TPA: hypothetical protein VEB21_20525, partial [Terriglobales bacterium]|nr:hypothetical protein [Terriglobales bacterium]